VYLSSESPTELRELEEDKYYIIGGLVDRNRYKGLTFRRAQEQAPISIPFLFHFLFRFLFGSTSTFHRPRPTLRIVTVLHRV
jgi:hypothetical protein